MVKGTCQKCKSSSGLTLERSPGSRVPEIVCIYCGHRIDAPEEYWDRKPAIVTKHPLRFSRRAA